MGASRARRSNEGLQRCVIPAKAGIPEPRHARPSLDARFRGHDTDVSKSSPHLTRFMSGEKAGNR